MRDLYTLLARSLARHFQSPRHCCHSDSDSEHDLRCHLVGGRNLQCRLDCCSPRLQEFQFQVELSAQHFDY